MFYYLKCFNLYNIVITTCRGGGENWVNRVRKPGTFQHVPAASAFDTLVWEQWADTMFLGNKIPRAVPQSVHSYLHPGNHRLHQGVDVLCSDGSTVYAPFTGRIVGQEKPYKNKNAINNGVRISGRGKGWCIYLERILEMFDAYLFNAYSIQRRFILPSK